MLRKVAVAGALALAAVVLAQGVALIGARGFGSAVSEDHRMANFRFDVKKLTSEPPRIGGQFAVNVMARDRRNVAIELRHLRDVAVGGPHRNVCEFGGGAVMRVRTPQGVHTIEGVLAVRVVDNRPPQRDDADGGGTDGEDRRFDTIEFTFTKPGTNFRYAFAGRVRQGDIGVFVRVP